MFKQGTGEFLENQYSGTNGNNRRIIYLIVLILAIVAISWLYFSSISTAPPATSIASTSIQQNFTITQYTTIPYTAFTTVPITVNNTVQNATYIQPAQASQILGVNGSYSASFVTPSVFINETDSGGGINVSGDGINSVWELYYNYTNATGVQSQLYMIMINAQNAKALYTQSLFGTYGTLDFYNATYNGALYSESGSSFVIWKGSYFAIVGVNNPIENTSMSYNSMLQDVIGAMGTS
jgi:hypothetical protein